MQSFLQLGMMCFVISFGSIFNSWSKAESIVVF